ncbi:MAG: HPr family phosphocarrier protein [Candidatus Ancillula sp.]|nr:HPr family phosphocarrier protein [Candidatus Ancillula sp.]
MKKIDYKVTDSVGIHARPAGRLVKITSKFESEVVIKTDTKSADAKKILAIMALGVKFGENISIIISGPDENTAFDEISVFLRENL